MSNFFLLSRRERKGLRLEKKDQDPFAKIKVSNPISRLMSKFGNETVNTRFHEVIRVGILPFVLSSMEYPTILLIYSIMYIFGTLTLECKLVAVVVGEVAVDVRAVGDSVKEKRGGPVDRIRGSTDPYDFSFQCLSE